MIAARRLWPLLLLVLAAGSILAIRRQQVLIGGVEADPIPEA